ncbi:MAG TPA: type II toxin-antitoxin system RelE/ParE family toxin [Candidatus Acidoferrales bacterium]|nr:type II toxin-antitoxin system RelE/ParE family toxin [Candidatus Acidoferrales bacterium]
MNYRVEYSEEAMLQLGRLDNAVTRRIMKKIESSIVEPTEHFKRLTGFPEYKLRVGDYSVIADIDTKKGLILIRTLGHRRDIYKKL